MINIGREKSHENKTVGLVLRNRPVIK